MTKTELKQTRFWATYVNLVCYTAVFSVVTQRSSPGKERSGEERWGTTLKTAV